jgi:molecular chaperone GrpE
MSSPGKPIKVTVVDRRHHAEPEAAAATDERSPYPSFVDELRKRAEAAEARAREAVTRADAEIDAVRDRLLRDVERRVQQGTSRLLCAMLEVVDNLDRALAASANEAPAVGRGIELVRQQMLSVLREEGVEPIEMVGQPYDPNLAEAVMVEPVERERDNLVLEELQRGYLLGEAVLRPARVKVGKDSSS